MFKTKESKQREKLKEIVNTILPLLENLTFEDVEDALYFVKQDAKKVYKLKLTS